MNRLVLLFLAAPAWAQNHDPVVTSTPASESVVARPTYLLTTVQRACAEAIRSELAKHVVTLKKPTYVYHWFRSDQSAAFPPVNPDAPDYQDKIRAVAQSKIARFWRSITAESDDAQWNRASDVVGTGMYAATDPISTSTEFGGSGADAPKQIGHVIRVQLPSGTKFLNFMREEALSFASLTPPCHRSQQQLYNPSDLDAYRDAVQSLGAAGIMYNYPSQRYDETGATRRAGDSMAFMLFDAHLLSAKSVTGMPWEKIINDIPPRATDLPESLYEKSTHSPLGHALPLDADAKGRLKEWAHENIIPMHPVSDFFDLPKEKKE